MAIGMRVTDDHRLRYSTISDIEVIGTTEWTWLACEIDCWETDRPEGDSEHRLVGSILKLYIDARVDEFFEARSGEAVTIEVHVGCVAAYNFSYNTKEKQRDLWLNVKDDCQLWADKFGCDLTFVIHEEGKYYENLP